MSLLKYNTARSVLAFMVSSTDHRTGVAGLTLVINSSKNGAAFASTSPTVTDLGNGWYAIALAAADTDTLGDLGLYITATGADPATIIHQVVPDLPGASDINAAFVNVIGYVNETNPVIGIVDC